MFWKDNLFDRPFMYEGEGDAGGGAAGTGDPPAGDPPVAAPLTFENFRKALPEDIRGEKMFDSFKTDEEGVKDFANSFISAQRLVGKKKEELIPGENATDEERAQFYELMGRPTNAEGYGLTEEVMKEAFPAEANMEYISRFAGVAHNLGLSQDQVEGLLAWQAEEVEQSATQIANAKASTVNELTSVWGGAAERHIALGQRAVKALGGEELSDFMNSSGAGNIPILVKAFAKVGSMMAERGLIEGDIEGLPSLEDAAAEANKIVSDKSHPLHEAYHDAQHANHDYATDRVSKLFETRYQTA